MSGWRTATAGDPALGGSIYELLRCERCGTARTTGELPGPAAHETAYYAPTQGLADRLIEPLRVLGDADRLRSARVIGPGSRVLEVGSGDGRLLARLKRRGAEVEGVEPSPAARQRSAAAGVPVIGGAVEDAEKPARPPTDVIAWHSLEHLDRPAEALRMLRGWMEPGARLVVATPNLASLQARIGGDRWFHQDVPRHRTHFTANGLVALVRRSGFEVTRVRHLVVEQNPLGMWQTLLNRVTAGRDIGYRMLKRDPALRSERRSDLALTALLAAPVALGAVALELAAAVARRGGTIVVEARADG